MEFAPPAAPLRPERVASLAAISEPLLQGVDWADRQDAWVGSRPCTADGLPLIGATGHERVFLAGGHGMYGVTLGAVTGKNLAQLMVTGRSDIDLAAFSPVR
jgi:D-amino-acid dehydrogenase